MARGNQPFTIKQLFDKLPEKYHKCITITSELNGILTKIHYKHPECGCEIDTCFKFIYMRKRIDLCKNCLFKEKIKDKSFYLDKIPEQYHQYIELSEEFKGCGTKIKFLYQKCGHKIDTIIYRLINQDQLKICRHCFQKITKSKSIYVYLKDFNKVDFKIIGKDLGLKTTIQYNGKICGHLIETNLQKLLNKKHFNYCENCFSRYLINIPEKYQKYIKRIEDINDPYKIKYINPGCGCITETNISSLTKRKQFEMCNKCITHFRIKTFSDYLIEIPKEYRNCITLIDNDMGFDSTVLFKDPNCGCETELTLRALTCRKTLEKCNKHSSWNRLSKEDMLFSIIYLDNPIIISGYPGNKTTIISGECKNCKSIVTSTYFRLNQYYNFYKKAQCKNCIPKNFLQHEVYTFVKSLNINVEEDNRNTIKYNSPRYKELDIYCPDNNFAIEFNGLIWHSEKYKEDKNYHINKTNACLDKNITLLHIWEDKYEEHRDIYYSIIKNKLNLSDNFVKSYKTKVKKLTLEEIEEFFTNNHLDGNSKCITGFGLYYNNKLIQAISVKKSSKKYNKYLEIVRFATSLNYNVVNGECKLLKTVCNYAKNNNYKGIVYYDNVDFGVKTNKKYKLKFAGITECDYCYTNGNRKFTKEEVLKQLKFGQTEKDMVEELQILRVNLTPNYIYIKSFEKEFKQDE